MENYKPKEERPRWKNLMLAIWIVAMLILFPTIAFFVAQDNGYAVGFRDGFVEGWNNATIDICNYTDGTLTTWQNEKWNFTETSCDWVDE